MDSYVILLSGNYVITPLIIAAVVDPAPALALALALALVVVDAYWLYHTRHADNENNVYAY